MEGLIQELKDKLHNIEKRLEELQALQKTDADEAIGQIGDLLHTTEKLEQRAEQLATEVEHHAHLLQLFRVSDIFGGT